MKTRGLIFYAAFGAAFGLLAGGAGGKALTIFYLHDLWWADAFFAVGGLAAAFAGGPASGSRRAAVRDGTAGFILAGAGFLLLAKITDIAPASAGAFIVGLVFFTFVFSAAVGASHAWSLRERDALLAAALFAGVAGLIGLAAGIRILSRDALIVSGAAAGAVYNCLIWLAIGIARKLFSVDVGQFRV